MINHMSVLGGVRAGPGHPVRIMGVINASPESFYSKSVHTSRTAIKDRAKSIEDEGASYVDVGGMSTAPYLKTNVSPKEESLRVVGAIRAASDGCNLPISVDTYRAETARLALEEGAVIINDVTGLKGDAPEMASVAARFDASVILCAYGGGSDNDNMKGYNGIKSASADDVLVYMTRKILYQSMRMARDAGISESKLAVDPSIGFFRSHARRDSTYTRISHDWASRDMNILSRLESIRDAPLMPILVSVSNKSFLGEVTGKGADDRLYGTVAAETIAVMNGADIIRTHNVASAKDAVSVASGVLSQGRGMGTNNQQQQ